MFLLKVLMKQIMNFFLKTNKKIKLNFFNDDQLKLQPRT